MKHNKDHAIVLSRVNYGEKDRILSLLCEDAGKISVLAKSVRAEKSRLAGGIELLCESEVTFIDGKSSLKTLTGARLTVHFSKLVTDMKRMQMAFDCLSVINGMAEEGTGQEYYHYLLRAFNALNDPDQDASLTSIWFALQVMGTAGTSPNLTVAAGEESDGYEFDYDHQQFMAKPGGAFARNDLKLLRLCATQPKPPKLSKPLGSEARLQSLVQNLLRLNITEV